MKRITEVLETFVPTKLLNLPKLRNNPDSRPYFRNEILHFQEDLEELTGNRVDEAQLRDRIVQYNKVRRLLKQFSELRQRKNPPLTGTDFLELVRGFYFLEPEEILPTYEDLYQKLSAQADEGEGKLRILLAGSIVADGDRRLLDLIENDLGLTVVVEDHCAGFKPFAKTIRETGDPYLALADGYLEQAPCARMKPLNDSLDFVAELVKDYRPDGVLYIYQKFCSCYGVGKKEFLDRFQALGVPALDLSSDYSENDLGQFRTRIEAFVEVLSALRSQKNEQYAHA
jgi:benzoyl-CoA reductase/2-hydroxyglutaryl-CoA dehydratase subunit BcrC/BadD/HgdB